MKTRLFLALVLLTRPLRWLWGHGRITASKAFHWKNPQMILLILVFAGVLGLGLFIAHRWGAHFSPSDHFQDRVIASGLVGMAAVVFHYFTSQYRKAKEDHPADFEALTRQEQALLARTRLMKTLPPAMGSRKERRL